MKLIDIKQVKCSVAPNFFSKNVVGDYKLGDIIGCFDSFKDRIEQLRLMPRRTKEEDDLFRKKKMEFPVWFPTGVFKGEVLNDNIVEYSNVVAVDIDAHEGTVLDIDWIKDTLMKLPYVFMVSKSISGKGVYALLLVEDGRYTKEYLQYIQRLWKQEYDIDIDTQCYNIARKRGYSYDDDLRIKDDNTDITAFNLRYQEKSNVNVSTTQEIKYYSKYASYNSNDSIDDQFKRKVYLLMKYGYDTGAEFIEWALFGRCFKPFDFGYDLFKEMSMTMSGYDSDFDKKWKHIRNNFDKESAVKYITWILNENYPQWKNDYYSKSLF